MAGKSSITHREAVAAANRRRKDQLGPFRKECGNVYGRWTVISDEVPRIRLSNGRLIRRVLCRCTCVRETESLVQVSALRNHTSQSCGCLHREQAADRLRGIRIPNAPTRTPEVGNVYGRWTVIAEAMNRERDSGPPVRYVLCRCECGTESEIQLGGLRDGSSRSCGCLALEVWRAQMLKHGCAIKMTPEYRAWRGMKSRCHGKNERDHARYAGRGITVCDQWRASFETFLADVGLRPSSRHSLDRINNDGNYEPDNVRWATDREQNRNTSANIYVEYKGERLILKDWALQTGVPADTLRRRLRQNWTVERILTTPRRGPQNHAEFRSELLDAFIRGEHVDMDALREAVSALMLRLA